MRSKVPVGKSSPRPHVQVNNYGRINSPGDDIRVAMAKNASKAASPTAASGASCDGDNGDEANGDDAEEDWPENGHDDSASGDDVGPADIEEDDWWNRPVGSDDEVEEWHAGDSDNDGGKDAHGDDAEAAADAQEAVVDANEEADDEAGAELETVAPADAAAVADADAVTESDKVAADAVLFNEEGGDDDPWSLGTDDDVPLLKRRLRHRLQSKSKRARVVRSDDDGLGEERRPILTAAEKGKAKVTEAPAKAPAKVPARRRTSNKKLTSDEDPGSSKGAAKKKAKKAPNPDDIVVNEPMGSDDEYAAAAGPIPTFPEKVTLRDPTLHNPNTRPPSSRSRDTTKTRRSWTVREKLKWTRRYQELGSLKKTSVESTASIACIRRLCAEAEAGSVVQAQDNGWMDESAVQTWLSKEVLPHLNPQRGQNARREMLVLDSYRGHITQTMLQPYRTHNITPAVTPAGCTSQIQPLDVSINRCFKAAVRARYARWFMSEGIHLKTKKGNLLRPPHPVVLQWIAEAWDQVPKQIIIDAFRHCGISSKLDGTQNHLVMSHLRARSTTDVSADMSLGGATGDNTRLLGRAPEEEEEEAMQAEGVREVAVANSLEVLYQETPNYCGAAAEADRMIEPRETARHAWRVIDLGVEPVVSAGEEAVTEGG
ncbi:unnamed protein product [Closterium sp. NIES-65]|nr:unnamed protein product [Closterium sp. NIES-65]